MDYSREGEVLGMTNSVILKLFSSINCARLGAVYVSHKPILILLLLDRILDGHANHFPFLGFLAKSEFRGIEAVFRLQLPHFVFYCKASFTLAKIFSVVGITSDLLVIFCQLCLLSHRRTS